MGESKRRKAMGLGGNGKVVVLHPPKVRVVCSIKVQTSMPDRAIIVMLGDQVPELACALNAEEARKLASALEAHASHLDAEQPRIILPGG